MSKPYSAAVDKYAAQRIKEGDVALFEDVFKEYYPRLCAFAQSFLGNRQEAEDIVGDFFVDLWEGRKKLAVATSLHAYLYASVRNRCLNYIKHLSVKDKYKALIQKHYRDDMQAPAGAPGDALHFQALQEKIKALLEGFPPQRRRVFEMSRFQEMKYAEIAQELGISSSAVKKHIVKALEQLREALRKEGLLGLFLAFWFWSH